MEKDLITTDQINYSLPNTWNYDHSVDKVQSLVFKWKNISVEILKELFIAREMLKQQGKRTDLYPNGDKLNWTTYLKEVGLPYETARRWLGQYDHITNSILPVEIEGNGLIHTEHKCPSCSYEW
jgi:hypothetical protein|tara:strand:- start:1581 stop:1952 length:372 start_codon:yes stop_codon:yes gene_type:complete